MAVSSNSYFSNSAQAPRQVAGDVDIYAAHSTPKHAIGERIVRQDGNEYVYSHFGAATAPGLLVSQDLSESALVDTDNSVIAPASAVTTTDGTIGSKYIQLTAAGVTAQQFAGGYLHATDDSGEAYTYRIKGNTATNDPASGDIRVELYDKLQVAVDATTDVAITGSLYANLEAATQATDEVVAGVSVANMSEGEFGWVQSKGVATVLTQGTVVIADKVGVGSVAGSVAAVAAFTTYPVGQVIHVGDDTGHSAVKLSL